MKSEAGANVQRGVSGGQDAWTCEFDPRNGHMKEIMPPPAVPPAPASAAATVATDAAVTAAAGEIPPAASLRHAPWDTLGVSSRSHDELLESLNHTTNVAAQDPTSAYGEADAVHQDIPYDAEAASRKPVGVTGGVPDNIPPKGAHARQMNAGHRNGIHQLDSPLASSFAAAASPVALTDTLPSELKPESVGIAAAAAVLEMAVEPTAQSVVVGGSKFTPLSPEGGADCGGEGQAGVGDGEKGSRSLTETELTPGLEAKTGVVGGTDGRVVAQAIRVRAAPNASEPAHKSYPGTKYESGDLST